MNRPSAEIVAAINPRMKHGYVRVSLRQKVSLKGLVGPIGVADKHRKVVRDDLVQPLGDWRIKMRYLD
jgi:hypothetical protein